VAFLVQMLRSRKLDNIPSVPSTDSFDDIISYRSDHMIFEYQSSVQITAIFNKMDPSRSA